MPDLLVEIGLEEVPARMLAEAEAEFAQRVRELLERERLLSAEARTASFSTPRRLAVLVHGVARVQADAEEEMTGPPVRAAYKDGQPTAAAYAFAKKAGVEVEALRTVTTPKGDYLAATAVHYGRAAAEVLAEKLPTEIASIYWAKTMYWRPGKPERFVRPVQWLLALLDEQVVPVTWGGQTAGRQTRGHRVLHGHAPVEIAPPAAYAETLRSAGVLANVEERRERIRKDLDRLTRTVPRARWREDHALVDKVTHLTEWPSVLMGGFEPDYLALPEEVLVTVMRDHQNYFAVEGSDGKLLPHFLAVLNTEPDEAAAAVIRHGNERVLRARFNDARFFYDFDQRTPLAERLALLEKVTFQKDLGSYAKKTARIRCIALELGQVAVDAGRTIDMDALGRAAELSKTDLTTELVKEFTELQGIVGGLYARVQGEPEVVAEAIYDQYLPASTEDRIPRRLEGVLLSLADKADTVEGMFGLGLAPTGSKDPFALRRAANGIIKMLAESTLPLTIGQVVHAAAGVNGGAAFKDGSNTSKAANGAETNKTTEDTVRAFLAERLEWYLRDVRGGAYDVVNAVMATRPEDVRDAMDRVDAVTTARGSEDFAAISAAFKRMRNIVEQARAKGESFTTNSSHAFTNSHLQAGEEKSLAAEAAGQTEAVETLRKQGNYDAALLKIASLRPAVDSFFDKVMVMAPEPELRAARLGLLQAILENFTRIADFSRIAV